MIIQTELHTLWRLMINKQVTKATLDNNIKNVYLSLAHTKENRGGNLHKSKRFITLTQSHEFSARSFPRPRKALKNNLKKKRKNKNKRTKAKASKLNFPWAKLNFPRKLNFLISLLFASPSHPHPHPHPHSHTLTQTETHKRRKQK